MLLDYICAKSALGFKCWNEDLEKLHFTCRQRAARTSRPCTSLRRRCSWQCIRSRSRPVRDNAGSSACARRRRRSRRRTVSCRRPWPPPGTMWRRAAAIRRSSPWTSPVRRPEPHNRSSCGGTSVAPSVVHRRGSPLRSSHYHHCPSVASPTSVRSRSHRIAPTPGVGFGAIVAQCGTGVPTRRSYSWCRSRCSASLVDCGPRAWSWRRPVRGVPSYWVPSAVPRSDRAHGSQSQFSASGHELFSNGSKHIDEKEQTFYSVMFSTPGRDIVRLFS